MLLNEAILYVGGTVLDISKRLLFSYFYDDVRIRYPYSQITYTDTDSNVYITIADDIFSDIEQIKDKLDTSDYWCSVCTKPCYKNRISSKKNAKIVGLMKDEIARNLIREFVAISPKQYAYITFNLCTYKEKQDKKCKGVNRKTVADEFEIESYKSVLYNNKQYKTSFKKNAT